MSYGALGVDYASIDGNEPPSFSKAYNWGARFAIMRGAYTDDHGAESDPTIETDGGPARAAGLQVGAYLILGWGTDATAQVNEFISVYPEVQPGDFPPSLDIEGISTTGQISPTEQLVVMNQIEDALAAMQAHYGTVMIYTSYEVWAGQMNNPSSPACSACPLWLKVGYPWVGNHAPEPGDIPDPMSQTLPLPWTVAGSPGMFIEQFQGDATGVPGFSSTVDLNTFVDYPWSSSDPRTAWVSARLATAGFANSSTVDSIRAFQSAHELAVDGILGPMTWAALCAST